MSAGQTGHLHGMVAVQTWVCPAEFLYVYCFFSLPTMAQELQKVQVICGIITVCDLAARFCTLHLVFCKQDCKCEALQSKGLNLPPSPSAQIQSLDAPSILRSPLDIYESSLSESVSS